MLYAGPLCRAFSNCQIPRLTLLTKHRYRVIPTALHYWLTNLVGCWNKLSEFFHRIILDLTKCLKWFIHNHDNVGNVIFLHVFVKWYVYIKMLSKLHWSYTRIKVVLTITMTGMKLWWLKGLAHLLLVRCKSSFWHSIQFHLNEMLWQFLIQMWQSLNVDTLY